MLKFVVVQATKLQQYSNTLHWFTVKVQSGPNAAEPQLPVGEVVLMSEPEATTVRIHALERSLGSLISISANLFSEFAQGSVSLCLCR